jgi:hypothetical protein
MANPVAVELVCVHVLASVAFILGINYADVTGASYAVS